MIQKRAVPDVAAQTDRHRQTQPDTARHRQTQNSALPDVASSQKNSILGCSFRGLRLRLTHTRTHTHTHTHTRTHIHTHTHTQRELKIVYYQTLPHLTKGFWAVK